MSSEDSLTLSVPNLESLVPRQQLLPPIYSTKLRKNTPHAYTHTPHPPMGTTEYRVSLESESAATLTVLDSYREPDEWKGLVCFGGADRISLPDLEFTEILLLPSDWD